MAASTDRERLFAALGRLRDFYPRQEIKPELVHLYAAHLEDVPVEHVEAAVGRIVCTSKFWPSLAEIREVAAEETLGLPSESEALALVERWIATPAVEQPCPACKGVTPAEGFCPRCRDDGVVRSRPLPPLPAPVALALDLVGGPYGFRAADEPTVVRGQFLRLYRDIRSGAVSEAQVGALPPAPLAPGLPAPRLRSIT